MTPARVLALWEPSRKTTGGQITAWLALLEIQAAGPDGVLIQTLTCSSSFLARVHAHNWIIKEEAEDARIAPGRCPVRVIGTEALGRVLGLDQETAARIVTRWHRVRSALNGNAQAWLMLIQYAALGEHGGTQSKLESTVLRAQIGKALRLHGHLVPASAPSRWRVPSRVLTSLGFAPLSRAAYTRAAL